MGERCKTNHHTLPAQTDIQSQAHRLMTNPVGETNFRSSLVCTERAEGTIPGQRGKRIMVSHSIGIQKNLIIYTTTNIMMKIRADLPTPDIALTKIAINSPVVIGKDAVSSLHTQLSGVVQSQTTLSLAEQMSMCKQTIRSLAR